MSKRSEKIMAALGVRLQRVRQEGTEHVTWEVAPSQSFRQESDHLEGNKTRQYPDNLIHFNETKTRENPDNNLMPFEGTETKENPENVMPLDETATRENSDNNLMLLDDTETKENPENVMPLEETETRKNPHNLMPLDENQQIDSRSRSPRSNRSSSRPSRSRSSRSRSRSSSRGSSCSYSQVDATSADSNYTTGDESNSDSNSSGSDSNSSDEENNSTRHNTVRNSPPHNNVVKEKQITKKRPKKPAQWRRNVCKKLRNCGQKYETLSKKKVVQERKILTPCNDKCRLKCTGKFTDEAREYIFDAFWKLGDLQKQRSFVLSSMRSIPKQYTKVRPEGGSQRGCNKAYYFSINDVLTQVCQKFFTSTLGISERFVRTVVSKSTDGFIEGEMRGKHKKRNVPEDVKEGIREHLRTIPALESHYTRSNTARMYIDGSKTLSQLYKDYKELCNEAGRPSGTISMYRHIFNYEFNMPFHIPKKDQCLTCTSYTDGDNNAKAELQDKYDSHIKEKELTRTEKSNDKDKINQNYVVACFDLQATLPVPKVCELQKKGIGNVDCYFWHEGEGKRGAIEIGTCLLKFLEKKAAAANSDELEIILYSDNCGGEGKNKFIVTILLYAVTTYKIKSITHKFFVVGHGQNEGDCTHSLIEKSIKRALKGGPIYVPAHYAAIISAARKSGTPFRVNEMDHSEFMDLKLFTKNVKTPFNQNTEKETFNFNSISIVKVEKCHPDRYFYKTSYSQTEYKSVLIVTKCQNTRRGSSSVADLELTSAYEQPLAVSTRKFEDLQSLLLNRSIPSVHSNFFRQLRKEN